MPKSKSTRGKPARSVRNKPKRGNILSSTRPGPQMYKYAHGHSNRDVDWEGITHPNRPTSKDVENADSVGNVGKE